MYPPAGETRKTMTRATSSGSASRPSGTLAARCFMNSPAASPCWRTPIRSSRRQLKSVSTIPGQTALTRTPCRASARAACCVSDSTAVLLAAYGGERLAEPRPAIDETLTIAPVPWRIITGAAACMQKKRPRALTAKVSSQSRSVTWPNGVGRMRPALFTRTSSRPRASVTRAIMRSISGTSATSAEIAMAFRPNALTSAATRSAESPRTSLIATSAPARARASAVARPMPCPAPVTRTTWPTRGSPAPASATDLLPAHAHGFREIVEDGQRIVPGEACVGDALAVGERDARADVLAPAHKVALGHDAEDVTRTVGKLGGDVACHGGLPRMILAAVAVRAVDHDPGRQARAGEHLRRLLHVLGVVIRAPVPATKDHVAGVVAARDHDGSQPLLRHGEELVRMQGRTDRVDRDLHVAVRPVLEPHRHGEPRCQLAVHLALGRPRADRTPRHEVGDELRRDRVQELTARWQPHLGQVEKKPP